MTRPTAVDRTLDDSDAGLARTTQATAGDELQPPIVGRKYEHSGIDPLDGVMFATLSGVIVAAIGGVVYCLAVTKVQSFFVEAIFTIIFAGLIGYTIGGVCRKFKVRSEKYVTAIVALATLVGLYSEWAFHPWFALDEDLRFIAWSPMEIFRWASLLFAKGGEFSGWFAVAIWIAEAGALFVLGLGFALMVIDEPFCETCDCWTEKREGVAFFAPPGPYSEMNQRLTDGEYRALLECEAISRKSDVRVEVNINMCPRCLDTCCLSATLVKTSINKKGEPERRETKLFEKVVSDREELAEIIAAGTLLERA